MKAIDESNPMLELVGKDGEILCVSKAMPLDSRLRKAWDENPEATLRRRTEADTDILAKKFVETLSPLFEGSERLASVRAMRLYDGETIAVRMERQGLVVELRFEGNDKEAFKAIGLMANDFHASNGRDMTFAELKREVRKC